MSDVQKCAACWTPTASGSCPMQCGETEMIEWWEGYDPLPTVRPIPNSCRHETEPIVGIVCDTPTLTCPLCGEGVL